MKTTVNQLFSLLYFILFYYPSERAYKQNSGFLLVENVRKMFILALY